MNLRSRASASAKGKAKVYKEHSSDDEDFGDSATSDSTFVTGGGGGEDEDEEIYALEEDSDASDTALLFRNDEDLPNPSKRMKRNSLKSKGETSNAVLDEEDGEGQRAVDVDVGIEPVDVILNIVNNNNIKKKKGKKKREDRPALKWELMEEEHGQWIAENSNKDIDLENQNEIVAETAEASDDLIIPLLRYQREWLAWASKQEESTVRGGILADEMGMGKTLQAIALVLFKRKIAREIFGHVLPSSSSGSSMQLRSVKGTLVICPLVAVMQWVGEVQKFTAEGSTKVLVYHGANRAKNHYQFSEYDFVITTYSIVEAEYRKYVMPPKEKCNYCGKLFYEHKLKIHLKYFCGPNSMRTSKQSKQEKKEPKPKKMLDSSKKKRTKERKECDLVDEDMDVGWTSENPVVNDRTSFAGKSILHSLFWNRVILDEAHYIKERRSNTTRAVLALQSSYKWALSGTPLQNRVGELYSLVRFLQIVPYSYYFCKDCDCCTLDYSTSADCPCCDHKSVRHFCWWNRNISSPIQDSGKSGSGGDAMLLLKHKILKSILLRRTKKGRAADLALPPRIVTLRRDTLDVVEEDYYTALYNESQAQFNTYIEAGTMSNNYAHIFDLLTRLRQAVDHPYLVEYSLTSMERKGNTVDIGDDVKCCLCHELAEDSVVTSCGHVFCKSCLIEFGATSGQNSCPDCKKALTVDFTTNMNGEKQISRTTVKGFKAKSILNRIKLENFQSSTKIDALREEIRCMIERDGSAKGIVFSQFSSFLDLIHYSLQKSGINCVQLDGSMTMNARDAAITKFTEDPYCKIFLMSLKAGGVALNLTVASQVFLMDPWWNPAVERQAQDRIHRIGQYKPIRIVRFVIEDTIEERILKLQEKKELVFEGTVGGSSEALTKLTEADLRFLFC